MSPVLVAVILAALWWAGAPRPPPDLRFGAPMVARPGETIGLRAWQVVETDTGDTKIEAPEVTVALQSQSGSVLAQTVLQKSRVQGSEGELVIPGALDDALILVAGAVIEGREVTVERTLYVQSSIESRAPRGRAVNPFQAYELGPLRHFGASHEIPTLDPRIEEGACVPELRCWLSVWVGDVQGRVRIVPEAGLRLGPSVQRVRDGFARFPLLVEGSESVLDVELLTEDGARVAARRARLPVVPGGLVMRAEAQGRDVRLKWDQLGGPGPVLIDVFDGGRWVDALSLSPAHPVFSLPGPGVWRIQARTDLFSDDTAGVTFVVVAEPGGPGVVRQAAEAVMADADREGLDPLAVAILAGEPSDGAASDAVAALFALPSFDVVSVRTGSSSRIEGEKTLDRDQDRWRWLAAGAIFAIGLLVSGILLRLDLLARADAQRLLGELGDRPPTESRGRTPGRGLWAFVLFVFAVMAVLALSKRWF